MYLYLNNQTRIFSGSAPVTILHIGAEYCLESRLRAIPKSRYITVDSMVSLVDLLEVVPAVCASVTELPFPSDYFDLVICSHVFEHVKDDRSAIAEVFRVVKFGGLAAVPIPIDWNRAETDEGGGLSAEERARVYGEADHVRQYGRDYVQRLKDVGFSVELYALADLRGASRYRIDSADPLIIGHKCAPNVKGGTSAARPINACRSRQ
jgi:SAM-dependent methyltransferase